MSDIKLSICIATFKRGDFIAETLQCLCDQLQPVVEIVVLDGASPDNTEAVVGEFARNWPQLRYYRETKNSGIDADYDKVVSYAGGEYVWLMTDDDLLVEGAVSRVLRLLETESPDVLVVDSEVRDRTMDQLLQRRRFEFEGMRTYSESDCDQLLADGGDVLSFIGGTIIRRSEWLARDRKSYYGTLFVHVGVLLQKPIKKAILLGESLIQIRFGNAMWSARGFEIWMFKWPQLIWSFEGYSDAAKAKVTPREPWRMVRKLLGFRANGSYGWHEYKSHFSGRPVGAWRLVLLVFAFFPGHIANLTAMILLLLSRHGRYRAACFALAWNSRFSNAISRFFARRSYRIHPA